jgi:antitoxin component YwqK of YwqJK toxin-antitoxin module
VLKIKKVKIICVNILFINKKVDKYFIYNFITDNINITNTIKLNMSDIMDTQFLPKLVRTYYNNRNIEEEYFECNNKKEGIYTSYKFCGVIKIRTCNYVNGKKHGEYKEYYDDGINIEFICNFNDGKKVGDAIFYYENGQIDNICNYENGNKNGVRYYYYKNGMLKKKCEYIDNMREGECYNYYQDGTLKSVTNYINDEVVYN